MSPAITPGPAIMGGINNAGVLVAGCQTKTSPGTTCILTPHHVVARSDR